MDFILGQVFGIFATVIFFLSYQVFEKKKLLVIQIVATLCTCISFLFLGATSGFALNIVCIIRNIAYYFEEAGTKICYITTAILTAIMCVLGALSWQGSVSLLIIAALVINTVCMSFGDPQLLRKSILVSSPLALLYNVLMLSVGGAINEFSAIVASVIGIIRYNRSKAKEEK